MLAALGVRGIGSERVVAQVVVTQQHRHHADAREDQHPQRGAHPGEPERQHLLHRLQPVHQRQQGEGGGQDHARLEASPRAVVAVKVHVEREHDDEGGEELRAHADDDLLSHRSSPSPAVSPPPPPRDLGRLAPESNSITPTAAAKTTVVSPMVS